MNIRRQAGIVNDRDSFWKRTFDVHRAVRWDLHAGA